MFIKPLYILQGGKARRYMTDVIIDNIICFVEPADSFDIQTLSEKIPNAIYNPEEFEGLSIKHTDLKTATIILSNGKIICTGAKNMEDAEKTITKTIAEINKTGLSIKEDFVIKIENIVASINLYKDLHLSSIANGLILQNVTYEPKDFPGLIYRINESNIEVILFSSGKMVCIGAKSIDEATKTIDMMEEKLSSIGAL